MGDTAEIIGEIMGAQIEIVTDEGRLRPENSEVTRLWADNTKALKLFGWRPSYAARDGFRRGLVETVEWFRQPQNLRNYKTNTYNI